MDRVKLQQGVHWLAEGGLNLFAVLDCAALPTAVSHFMQENGLPLAHYGRLVLIGHGGKQMWSRLQAVGMNRADPVDMYSLDLTRQFIAGTLDGADSLVVYPSDYLTPLGQLGELAGWSHPSPLGQGIHPEYGLWFAYRATFLTTADLPVITSPPRPSPCNSCANKPCLSACPVGAAEDNGRFHINRCVQHRLQLDSPCADRCLARMACPIAPQHRYTLPQIQYHYRDSLQTLKKHYF